MSQQATKLVIITEMLLFKHIVRILEAATPGGRLLGIDADARAIERSTRRLAPYGERAIVRQANFETMAEVASDNGFEAVDGILSSQLDAARQETWTEWRDGVLEERRGEA